ncbi:MAG: CDP-alcohol phosphatidyltransferase family protein [Kiritimatiellae bacterium]|nr:CDP-alcohol phosphatidyltransferase family protein [Kiritimatiellia bacterium]
MASSNDTGSNHPRYALWIVTALTLARVPLVLVFMAGALVQLHQPRTWLPAVNLALLVLASLTDLFDGWLARRWRVTSNFGALADPLMDKVFYIAVFPTLTFLLARAGAEEAGHALLMLCFTVLYLLRDQWVSFLRALAAGQADMRANWMGKLRTAISFPIGCLLYLYLDFDFSQPSRNVMMGIEIFGLALNLLSVYVYTRRYAPALRKALAPKA